jgi:hypothetical protein
MPTWAVAQESRVLILTPESSNEVVRDGVETLKRTIRQERAELVLAEGLSTADVVVEFTDYQVKVGKKGPEEHWVGNYKVLVPRPRDADAFRVLPEKFTLLVIGHDETDLSRAAQLLRNLVARALGRKKKRAPSESI